MSVALTGKEFSLRPGVSTKDGANRQPSLFFLASHPTTTKSPGEQVGNQKNRLTGGTNHLLALVFPNLVVSVHRAGAG